MRRLFAALALCFGLVVPAHAESISVSGGNEDAGSGTVNNCGSVGGLGYYASTGTAISCSIGITATNTALTLGSGVTLNIASGDTVKYNGVVVLQAVTANNDYYFGGSGNLTTTGTNNTGLGGNALQNVTSGLSLTGVGFNALANITVNYYDVGIGDRAGLCLASASNATAYGNVALGHGSMAGDDASPVPCTGNQNAAIGSWTLQELTTGNFNVAVGSPAMSNSTSDSYNVAVGFYSLMAGHTSDTPNLNSGSYNVALGSMALFTNTASGLVAVGYKSLYANTSGQLSTAVGYQSLMTSAGSGDIRNTVVGYNGLATLNGASDNTGLGAYSLLAITTGGFNSALGSTTGDHITTGVQNLVLGYGVASTTLAGGSRNILLGTNTNCDTATAGTNDNFQICASSGSIPLLSGNLAAASLSLLTNGTLTVAGIGSDATHTDATVCEDTTSHLFLSGSGTLGICLGTSGRQFKTIDGPMTVGISELTRIGLYDYHYLPGYGDNGKRLQYGAMAQDVENVMPILAGHDATGATINYDAGAMLFLSMRAIQQIVESCHEAVNDNFCVQLLKRVATR